MQTLSRPRAISSIARKACVRIGICWCVGSTAEAVWRKRPGLSVRSAWASRNAGRTIDPADIRWADVIMVMESKHQSCLLAEYPRLLQHKPLYVLDIPDGYSFIDPELVELLQDIVGHYLDALEKR